jgi:hypothetical protein
MCEVVSGYAFFSVVCGEYKFLEERERERERERMRTLRDRETSLTQQRLSTHFWYETYIRKQKRYTYVLLFSLSAISYSISNPNVHHN